MTLFARLAAITAVFVFVQIVLGAVVRLTNSGLSCPDWPLCYGLWLPTPAKLAAIPGVDYSFGQVMAEWTHRLNAAAVVTPLVVVLVALAWRLRRERTDLMATMAWALAVLAAQAVLGGFTVLDRNSPWSVAVHLTAALLLLALVLRAHMAARGAVGASPVADVRHFANAALLLTLITVAGGAMVAKSGATLACASWPLCDGALVPDLGDALVRTNFGHRLLALGTAAAVFALWRVARRLDAGARGPLVRAANMALATLALQIAVGALVVPAFAGGSLALQVAAGTVHQAVGVVLFATLAVMLWRAQAVGSAGGRAA